MPLLFIDSKKLQLTFLMSVFTPLFYLLITCNKRGKQNSSRSFEGRTSATARSLSKNTAINDDCCNLVLHSAILNTTSLDTISYQSYSTYVKKKFVWPCLYWRGNVALEESSRKTAKGHCSSQMKILNI